MKPYEALTALQDFAAGDLGARAPRDAFDVFFEFYAQVRAEGCDVGNDGDMLLFQWGTYDWGDGERFEFGLTRQFMWTAGDDEDEQELWQLSVTFRMPPTDRTVRLGAGDRWCGSPSGLQAFREWVRSTAVFSELAGSYDGTAEVRFESAE